MNIFEANSKNNNFINTIQFILNIFSGNPKNMKELYWNKFLLWRISRKPSIISEEANNNIKYH